VKGKCIFAATALGLLDGAGGGRRRGPRGRRCPDARLPELFLVVDRD